jgi:ABC-type Zn2+ transport system substrate-binding protein/surface adhesin
MVLVYGLVVAPVMHAVVDHDEASEQPVAARGWVEHADTAERAHEHANGVAEDAGHTHGARSHGHEHGPGEKPGKKGPGHEHQWGSVEHLQAVALSSVAVLAPTVRWVALPREAFHGPLRRPGEQVRPTAMPQGP